MKKLTFLSLILASILLLTSCNKEQRCIDRLDKLVTKTEQKADQLDKQQWQDVVSQYQEICAEMEKYSYTDEQLQHIGRLKGRFYAVAAKYQISGKGGLLNSVFRQGIGIFEGLMNGVDEDFDSALDDIKGTLKDFKDSVIPDDLSLQELEQWFE